jgi:hypothetical protein
MPIHQFWEPTNHGAICGGTSAQPFKTEKDYTNFLKEWMYSIWLDSAMVYMKKGIEKELCYQRR